MLSFAYPWAALAAPLPLLVYFLAPPHARASAGLRVPFFGRLSRLTGAEARAGLSIARRGVARTLVLGLCWLLALAALMRPQWVEPPIRHETPARDLLLLVDLSASMDTRDFADGEGRPVSRLDAAKAVLDDFLKRREGDRVGIVVFGNAAFVLVPFTTDLALARRLLWEMQVGMAGPRTVFGDAIGLGITLFEKSDAPARTIIALTDGNDTASRVPPAEAARVARDRHITLHTVAMGDPAAAGEDRLDEAALKAVAQASGGRYFRALDGAGLADIYATLDAIETRKVEVATFQPRVDLYYLPLAALTVLALAWQALSLLVPRAGRRTRLARQGARA